MASKTTAYRIRIGNDFDMTVPAARLSAVLNNVLHTAGGVMSIDVVSNASMSRTARTAKIIWDGEENASYVERMRGNCAGMSNTGRSAKRLVRSIRDAVGTDGCVASGSDYAIVSYNDVRQKVLARIAASLQSASSGEIGKAIYETESGPSDDVIRYETIVLDESGVAHLSNIMEAALSERVSIKPLKGKYRIRQWFYEQIALTRPILTPLRVIVAIAMMAMLLTGNFLAAALDGGLLVVLCLLHSLSLDYSFAGMTIYGTLQDDAGPQDYSTYYARQQIIEMALILIVTTAIIVLSIVIALGDATLPTMIASSFGGAPAETTVTASAW